jgi:L-ascorbate 6-phosphate lactonase
MNFIDRIRAVKAGKTEIAIVWLGQAGFLIKTHEEKIILIDPYFSDYVNRVLQKEYGQGFRRMSAPVCDPDQMEADILLCSHEHQDHLDIDSLPDLLRNPDLVCYANEPSIKEAKKNGIAVERFRKINKGDLIDLDECELHVLDCDHGQSAPEAMGFILDFGFLTLYYSGDTGYNKARLGGALARRIDLALLPINGAFGNLNAHEAARLAGDLKAKMCIPHHFWTFPLHDGSQGGPMEAIRCFPSYAPDCILRLVSPGEVVLQGPFNT